jgi:hypothetical protein
MVRYYSRCLGLLALIFIGCASTAPLPTTLNIVPPTSDIQKEIAAFSGVWEGKMESAVDTILVVEKINTDTAEVIISFGEWIGVENRYMYATAKVLSGPSIEWINSRGNRVVYQMNKDLKSINGFIEEKSTGARFRIYMTRSKSQ